MKSACQRKKNLGDRRQPVYISDRIPSYSTISLRLDGKESISLAYPGKQPMHEFVRSIPSIDLKMTGSHGQRHLHRPPNRLILGDNLSILARLLDDTSVEGKVRLVYIDPPFSTNQTFRGGNGNGRTATISAREEDTIAYEDKRKGTDYLEFLRQRLILLREILADNGSIYLHIDNRVGHYVKLVMDEVFGRERFINDITRVKCNPKNFSRNGYGNIKDMILFYAKSKDFLWNEPREEMDGEEAIRLFPKTDRDGRRYTTTPLHAPGETKKGATGQPWKGMTPPPGRHWRIPPDELTKMDRMGLVEWSRTGNPRKKIYADEVLQRGKKVQDVWELKDPPYPSYPTEKNREMLQRIIGASSREGDIVLDCFAGSGTTLVAAELSGRRWIGIDNSRTAIETAIGRLNKIPELSLFNIEEARERRDRTFQCGSFQRTAVVEISRGL